MINQVLLRSAEIVAIFAFVFAKAHMDRVEKVEIDNVSGFMTLAAYAAWGHAGRASGSVAELSL